VVNTPEIRRLIPEQIQKLSIEKSVELIDSMSNIIAGADSQTLQIVAETMDPDLLGQLPLIVQLLTVPIRLYADVRGVHRIQSDYSVSYAKRFAPIPGAGVRSNNNPIIDSVGIYKVKGNSVLSFDADDANVEFLRLPFTGDSATAVAIDKGYTYFIEAFAGVRDTVVTLGDIAAGDVEATKKLEEVTAEWLYQFDRDEIEDLSPNSLMNITALTDLRAVLSPPQAKEVREFTVWVQLTDSKIGVLNRSQGSTVAEVHGIFSYTEDYLSQFE
jgi:hypothetical protein